MSDRALKDSDTRHVVIVVHGIRTDGHWMSEVREYFENMSNQTIKVYPIKYGYYDLFRFLTPFRTFRHRARRHVEQQILTVLASEPDARVSLIAHSFGAYVVCQALLHPTLSQKFHALIMAGAVVPDDYPWHLIKPRFDAGVRNDCSYRDVYPVAARALTIGYGAIGTFGANNVAVENVRHIQSHSGYFRRETYAAWANFILNGKVVRPARRPRAGSGWSSWVGRTAMALLGSLKMLVPLLLLYLGFVQIHPPILAATNLEGVWRATISWNPEPAKNLFGANKVVNDPHSRGTIWIYEAEDHKLRGFSSWELRQGEVVYSRLAVQLSGIRLDDGVISFDLETFCREKKREFQYLNQMNYRMELVQSGMDLKSGKMVYTDGTGKRVEAGTVKFVKQ